MSESRQCWCGSEELTHFDDDYLNCDRCGSLVVRRVPCWYRNGAAEEVSEFYGPAYWHQRQRDGGRPGIEDRNDSDPGERGLHWLRIILKYMKPPGTSLEIGCAHGAFVALLRMTGFEAAGLEVNEEIAAYARRKHGVPVFCGLLEDLTFESGTFDLIILMDVVEHLARPREVLAQCAALLKPTGILVIQTPCRPSGGSKADLLSERNRFLEILIPDEHLFLFCRSSLSDFCHRLGLSYMAFEPAVFGDYDMCLVAGSHPLTVNNEEVIRRSLEKTRDGRLLRALLDTSVDALNGPQGKMPTMTFDRTIVVDLTPVLPGWENGGAKLITLALVEALGRLAPDTTFLLLTSQASHPELAYLESANVTRVPATGSAISTLSADPNGTTLQFYPFTDPRYADPRVPVVCLIHDLQHVDFPQFFDDQERRARQDALERVVRHSIRIVTVSKFGWNSVVDAFGVSRDRVVHIGLGRMKSLPSISRLSVLPGRSNGYRQVSPFM